jgi:hypothetical protein
MALEKVIVDYDVEISKLEKRLIEAQSQFAKTGEAGKKSTKAVQDGIDGVDKKVKTFSKDTLDDLGKRIALAFSVGAIIAFGKESVKAFQEAELNAKRLESALKNIAGEGDSAFNRLITQSQKLQRISIFSDDSIQKAQTQLIQLGLTSQQVEKLLPQIVDLASATGIDLTQATDLAISGINGVTRSLRPYGLEFEVAGSKTENLAILSDRLSKFQGQTATALEASAGRVQVLENKYDDLKEEMGERLIPVLDFFLDRMRTGIDLIDVFSGKVESNNQAQFGAEGSVKRWAESLKELPIDELNKKLSEQVQVLNKVKEGFVSGQLGDANLQNEIDKYNALKKVLEEVSKTKTNIVDVTKLSNKELSKLGGIAAQDELEKRNKATEAQAKLDEKETDRIEKQQEKLKTLLVEEEIFDREMEERKTKKKKDEEEKRLKDKEEYADRNLKELIAIEERRIQEEERIANEAIDIAQREANAKIVLQRQALFAISSFLSVFGDKSANFAKSSALFEIGANLAVSISEAIKDGAKLGITPIEKAALIATGIAQVVAATAQAREILEKAPIPKFSKGVIGFKGVGTGTSDENLAWISNEESIITAMRTKQYREELKAIETGKLNELINRKHVLPALKKAGENELFKDLAASIKLNSGFDDYRIVKGLKPLKNMATSDDINRLINVLTQRRYR